eukprot:g46601.t1
MRLRLQVARARESEPPSNRKRASESCRAGRLNLTGRPSDKRRLAWKAGYFVPIGILGTGGDSGPITVHLNADAVDRMDTFLQVGPIKTLLSVGRSFYITPNFGLRV